MVNEGMITPPVTSLGVDREPSDPETPRRRPWKKPFLELLRLLKIIDNSKPTPRVEDQHFCFQPSNDLSEISRIFLSVSTVDLQYDIDLKTIRVVGSDIIPSAVAKLQEYANKVLERIRQFRDCLLQRDVINDSSGFLYVDLFTCPICLGSLASCLECDAKVACSVPLCRASRIIGCEHCYAHERMVCHACLTKNDTVPLLICCPTCQGWCCREDSNWCAGLVLRPTPGSEELAELSRECEWDSETIVRSHPPKPGPCKFCVDDFAQDWATCRNSIIDAEPDRCPSQTPFMSEHGLHASYCPECIEQSPGCRCACEGTWLCNICVALGNKTIEYPYLITCPRCGVSYCTGPDTPCGDCIELCRGCKGVILCDDCQETEELPGDVQTEQELPKRVVFTQKCTFCEAWSCSDCYASERTGRCFHCSQWFCYNCISDLECDIFRQCPFCSGPVCRDCRMQSRGCTGSMMLWVMMPPSHF